MQSALTRDGLGGGASGERALILEPGEWFLGWRLGLDPGTGPMLSETDK